jgi:hypothetical protein
VKLFKLTRYSNDNTYAHWYPTHHDAMKAKPALAEQSGARIEGPEAVVLNLSDRVAVARTLNWLAANKVD